MDMVSILIPAYKPNYFQQALTSALSQTWSNKEIIVSDDCPTEAIKEICGLYDGLITYQRNPSPGSMGRGNWLNLLNQANGDYCKFLCDDDILDPFCVQHLLEAYQRHSSNNVNLVFSPRTLIDEKNQFLNTIDHFPGQGDILINGLDMLRVMAVCVSNPIGEPTTILFKRDSIPKDYSLYSIGDLDFKGAIDVAFYMHLLPHGNVLKIEGVRSFFRMHSLSTSNPIINPEWINTITMWSNVIRYADRQKLLSTEQRVQAYLAYRRMILGQIPRADHLLEEAVESLLALKADMQLEVT